MISRLRARWRFFLSAFILVTVGGLVHVIGLLPRGRRERAKSLGRLYMSRAFMGALKVRPEVTLPPGGLPEGHGGMLLVANHASFLDILVLASAFDSIFVAKASVRDWPIFGTAVEHMGCIFLKRDDPEARFALLAHLGDHIPPGQIATVFPQGTTSHVEPWFPFQRGIFKVLDMNPELSLLPVTLRYHDMAEVVWRDEPFLANFKKICARDEIRVDVIAHPPISSDEVRGMRARKVSQQVETMIRGPLLQAGGGVYSSCQPSTQERT